MMGLVGVARAANTGRLILAVASLGLFAYWATVSVPAIASPSRSGFAAIASTVGVDQPRFNDFGRVETLLGCADGTDAASLDRFFAERQGPLVGWDNPHVTVLDDDRSLWLMHDTYLDYSGTARTLDSIDHQIQNAAMIQTGSCFTIEHLGTPTQRVNFESGDERIVSEHFLWPLGSEVDGDRIWVFWGETATAEVTPPRGQGISRYPVATWLASYDIETLRRLSFDPAPNAGVDPVYGFAVSSDETHSYLFANTNQLNYLREGGYSNGPHSATRMYLGRVAKGQLDHDPLYWNGAGWSASSDDAVPISDRFYAENTMQPRYIDGQWISVVQRDGFHGVDVWLEVARDPWGPWIASETIAYEPRPSTVEKNSYQPIILPSSSAVTGIQIVISENAVIWHRAIADPSNYRPAVFEMEWPGDPDRIIEDALARLAGGSADPG